MRARRAARSHLTAREFELLAYLMRHPNQVLSRSQILNAVWGYDYDPGTNVLEVYIGYLRKKLAAGDGARADRDGALRRIPAGRRRCLGGCCPGGLRSAARAGDLADHGARRRRRSFVALHQGTGADLQHRIDEDLRGAVRASSSSRRCPACDTRRSSSGRRGDSSPRSATTPSRASS